MRLKQYFLRGQRVSSMMNAAILAYFLLFQAASAADNSRSSGFLNAVGGLLNRQPAPTNAANTNAADRATVGLRILNGLLSQPQSTNAVGTNTTVLADRLGAFLGGQTSNPTNSATATNLVQKLRDWLQAQQSAGTNSTTTNIATQRSWMALTNFLATHAGTNSASSNSLTDTNLFQKVRAWVATEQRSQTNTTNNASLALNSLAGLLNNATNQTGTNIANLTLTNSSPAVSVFRGFGSLLDRNQKAAPNTNSDGSVHRNRSKR